MANQPKTKARSIRIDDERWARVNAAATDGKTASDVVREAIDVHLGPPPPDQPKTNQSRAV
jgi:predicted DNA-binding protein